MNTFQQMRQANIKRAYEIVDSLPREKDEFAHVKLSRNKELRKWQAAACVLAEELRRPVPTVSDSLSRLNDPFTDLPND